VTFGSTSRRSKGGFVAADVEERTARWRGTDRSAGIGKERFMRRRVNDGLLLVVLPPSSCGGLTGIAGHPEQLWRRPPPFFPSASSVTWTNPGPVGDSGSVRRAPYCVAGGEECQTRGMTD